MYPDGRKAFGPTCAEGVESCVKEGEPQPVDDYKVYKDYEGNGWRYRAELFEGEKNMYQVIGHENHTLGVTPDEFSKYTAFKRFAS